MITTPHIIKAVNILRAGGLVAMPTETVYGLGADAQNETALKRIFLVKERPFNHPLIVHLAHLEQLTYWAKDVPMEAYELAKAFWPGPLTLILKKQPHVLDIVTGGQDTVGLRIPNHPIAQSLLNAFGDGIAAPSANKFTHISPTSAAHVYEELGDQVDLILDGGDCEIGLESTIVDLSGKSPRILRPGMLGNQAIAKALGREVLSTSQKEAPRAPGMHHLHYAPITKTVLIETSHIPQLINTLLPTDLPIALLTYSQIDLPIREQVEWIKMPTTPEPYAHDLYQTLRLLDHKQLQCIYIEKPPTTSAWEAINDRLLKASLRG